MTTREFGLLGESCAAEYLESRGYTVLSRNVHVGHGEIDIIAQRDEYLIFAEVKTRRQKPDSVVPFGTPASAVNEAKQKNIIRALEGYLTSFDTALQPRIDVIEVYISPIDETKVLDIRHYENAVRKRGKFSRNPRR